MCGRFDRHTPLSAFEDVVDGLSASESHLIAESYNIAPSQNAAVIRGSDRGPELVPLHWGFVPAWSKNKSLSRPINARGETLSEKAMFKDAFKSARCLVLCDGYYEWQKSSEGSKTPFYITPVSDKPFVMAGLWARNEALEGKPIETFCIITVEANASCKEVHHRMPLILDVERHREWLVSKALAADAKAAMLRVPDIAMRLTAVSRFVNSPANNSPQCIAPIHGSGESA